ncbi:hypothetical protein JCM8547_008041 [Rhodosporidiobolus lusitaniae]
MAQTAQQGKPPTAGPSSFTWEGDATLHSYCYDYMRKRGWHESASSFAKDAGIEEATWTGPPIEAPQGLLYEWWSVFWDVFIARSQKAGQRNPNADVYVDAMRAKRDPLVVQFAGANAPPPMSLPRSLAHPPRAAPPTHAGPPRAQYSQMHVLEQQELQNQMQRGQAGHPQFRRMTNPNGGPPPPGGYGPPGSQALPPPPSASGHPQGPPQHGQNPAQPLIQTYPPQNPHQPPSSIHSSPHMVAASPYSNGRPPGPPVQGGMQQHAPGSMSQAMANAMAAVGLGGRDPESLSQEEHAAVAAQMRRVGALPPTTQQQQLRNQQQPPQQVRIVQQRVPSDQQLRQQGGYMGMPQQGQPMMQDPNRPGMQQGPPQQRMMQQQYVNGPGQVGSPASPAYSAAPSPYATPLVAHMSIPPSAGGAQGSPQHFAAPLPPPSRAGQPKNRIPSAAGGPMQQGSPAQMGGMVNPGQMNVKRVGGSLDEPSPRGRKRVRGATRDEEMFAPETPNFEPGGPGSPGGMGMPPGVQGFLPDGLPYRPSPSPSLMQGQNRPPPPGMQQQQHGQQQPMYVMGPSPGGQQFSGDPGMNGGHPGMNGGHPGMNGGPLSRPASAASNHFLSAPPPPGPDQRLSPVPPPQGGMSGAPSQHPSPSQLGGLPTPSLGADLNNGARPFAGAPAPPSASNTPLPPAHQPLPTDDQNSIPVGLPGSADPNGGAFPLNLGGGGDNSLGEVDFESFLNGDMFAEDGGS